jgi:adenosylcobinamide kinase / adenosylcobinamide-phosphate guanylyltransferase
MLTLITGGARSGKSSFGQSLCRDARVVYIATAIATDEEMCARIKKHQESRPASWATVEEPIEVAKAIACHVEEADVILIDCLTLWLSNLLFEWRDQDLTSVERRARAAKLINLSKRGNIIAVTNEVGSGIVPESLVARQFRDIQGLVNQQIARAADVVYLMISGIPMCIKPAAGAARRIYKRRVVRSTGVVAGDHLLRQVKSLAIEYRTTGLRLWQAC